MQSDEDVSVSDENVQQKRPSPVRNRPSTMNQSPQHKHTADKRKRHTSGHLHPPDKDGARPGTSKEIDINKQQEANQSNFTKSPIKSSRNVEQTLTGSKRKRRSSVDDRNLSNNSVGTRSQASQYVRVTSPHHLKGRRKDQQNSKKKAPTVDTAGN